MTIDDRYMMLTTRIAGITHSIQQIKNIALKPYGLKGRTVNCLFHLYRCGGGITLLELAKLCGEDKAAISRCVTDLRKMGYVTAISENGKRRKKSVSPSTSVFSVLTGTSLPIWRKFVRKNK